MVSCGHSFSRKSLARWLATQRQSGKEPTCPVCKATVDGRPVPNFALRSAIARYCKLNDIPSREPSIDEVDETADDEVQSLLSESAAPQRASGWEEGTPALLVHDRHHNATRGHAPNPWDQHPIVNTCLCFECRGCGMCAQAVSYEDAASGCRSGILRFLPTYFLSGRLCSFSFGRRSSWCTRTLCGLAFPLFLVFFICFSAVDSALMLVLVSLWASASLVSLVLCYWWLQLLCCASHACCPIVSRSPVVVWPARVYNGFCGFFLLPELDV